MRWTMLEFCLIHKTGRHCCLTLQKKLRVRNVWELAPVPTASGGEALPSLDMPGDLSAYCRCSVNTCGIQEGRLSTFPSSSRNSPKLFSKTAPSKAEKISLKDQISETRFPATGATPGPGPGRSKPSYPGHVMFQEAYDPIWTNKNLP